MDKLYRRTVSKGGRVRYEVAGLDMQHNLFGKGAHLLLIGDDWGSYHRNVDPDKAGLLAAAKEMRDAMTDAISGALKLEPKVVKQNKVHQDAWSVYTKYLEARGEEPPSMLIGKSAYEIVDAGINALMESEKSERIRQAQTVSKI